MIHERGLLPSEAESFTVAPGTEMLVAIRKTEVLFLKHNAMIQNAHLKAKVD